MALLSRVMANALRTNAHVLTGLELEVQHVPSMAQALALIVMSVSLLTVILVCRTSVRAAMARQHGERRAPSMAWKFALCV